MKLFRHFTILLVLMFACLGATAQTTGFNYQAVIRNAVLQPISSQSGVATISILGPGSTELYREIQTINTDAFGLFSLVVGRGTALSGNFSTIDWGSGGRSVKVSVSIGGNSYDFAPSELQAVPYAKVAEKTLLGDGDSDPNNEIQQISLSGNTLTLSNGGGSVTLPNGGGSDAQTLSVNGNQLSISNGNTVTLPAEVDGSTTNELQAISLSGNTISLSNGGGSITLPAEVDGSVTNEIQTLSLSGNTLSLSNGGGSVTLQNGGGSDAQTLSVNGNQLSISNGNTVNLPAEVDGSVTNEIQTLSISGNIISLSNGGGAVNLPAVSDNDAQTLSINGNTLSISNGNTVALPTPAAYVAGQGIGINGANVISNTGDINPADDITNATAAGGDLSGFYPTPQIAANAVTSAKIADGSIIAADLAPGIIPQSINDLNDVTTTGAAAGQVLKWNGAQWVPQDDNTSSGSGNTATTAPLSGNGSAGSPVTIGQNGALNGQVLKWNGVSWAPANDNDAAYIAGAGIVINGSEISASDPSTTNELQTLSLNGAQLSISNGNTVNLPAEVDGSVTNEIQTLSLSGNQLSLSNGGGSVTLPATPTYTAGAGINISGSTISNTGDTDASNDITTTTTAGGDISGTFSNLQIAPNAVGTNEIANGSITAADLAPGLLGSSPWSVNGNDIFNNNTGNVGIGTNSPGSRLGIVGTNLFTDGLGFIGNFLYGIHCDPDNAAAAFATHPIGLNTVGLEAITNDAYAIVAKTEGLAAPVAIFEKNNNMNYDPNLVLKGNVPLLEFQNNVSNDNANIRFTEPSVGNQISEWFMSANPDKENGYISFSYSHANNLFLDQFAYPLHMTSKGKVGINNQFPQAGLDVKPRLNSETNLMLSPYNGNQTSSMAMRTYENGSSYDQFNINASRNSSNPELAISYQSTTSSSSSLNPLFYLRPYSDPSAEVFGNAKCYDYLSVSNKAYLGEFISGGGSFGLFQTLDASNNPLALISTLNGTNNKGYASIFSNGVEKAGMYVNASNQGIVFGTIKTFRMDDPRDKNKEIWYACVEGPEAAAYERGTATLKNGTAEVLFSDHFEIVANSKTMTVILTPLSADSKGLAVVEKSDKGFKVKEMFQGDGNYQFDWEVKCVRKGFEDFKVSHTKGEDGPSVREFRK